MAVAKLEVRPCRMPPLTYSVGDIRARRRDDPFRFEADGAALVALLARSKILLNADLAMLT
jgi:hypothetical protein